jgi:hypothetical protein
VRQFFRRMYSLPALACASAVAATALALVTYLQWRTERDCVRPAVCIEIGTRANGSPICKDLGCGPDPWLFGAPGAILGVVAVLALIALVLRSRRHGEGLPHSGGA